MIKAIGIVLYLGIFAVFVNETINAVQNIPHIIDSVVKKR